MKICVQGLWHLGTVMAACLAAKDNVVTGLDYDPDVVANLQRGVLPVFEPALEDLVRQELARGTLSFTSDPKTALTGSEIVWIGYDTPVDEEDRADAEFVIGEIEKSFAYIAPGATVIISSQLPVGSTRAIEARYQALHPAKPVDFAYSPENLRLGKAVRVFMEPDRVVMGVRTDSIRDKITRLLVPFTGHIEWMSVESAEMTKHAINAFLATSITFINEIATLCEKVGADAKEVERGLKSEARIGPKAYLSPGGPFAGGTLARDVMFLNQLGQEYALNPYLFDAILKSNQNHKAWPIRRFIDIFESVQDKVIAVWGLTYKPGTNTLRRSAAVELCRSLAALGASIQAHDPAIQQLPDDLAAMIKLAASPLEAVEGADALLVATEWPVYQGIGAPEVLARMRSAWVLDANRFLKGSLGSSPCFHYLAVGQRGGHGY